MVKHLFFLQKAAPIKNDPFPDYIKQAKVYLECERKHRMLDCYKHDMSQLREEFGLHGLGHLIDHLDDDDKIIAVIVANQEVGDSNFGLFE